jgi:UDP-glucose 4-epimerase
MNVLVTGGAGYIGAHVCVALCEAGYQPVILDSFDSTCPGVVERLTTLTGKAMVVERGDLLKIGLVLDVLQRHHPCAVIHLAHQSGELATVAERLHYLSYQLTMIASVLRAMEMHGVHTLQVASSAEVYQALEPGPLAEHSPLQPINHVGHTHMIIENLLEGVREVNPAWRMAVLRHFNIGGAHPSGLIGPSRRAHKPGLLHSMARASLGSQPQLDVFDRHPCSPDGSAVHDIVHVCDVARAHVAALDAQLDFDEGFCINVGSGRATSTLELITTYEKTNQRLVPWRHSSSAAAAAAAYRVADIRLATQLLGWKPKYSLEDSCADTLRWHSNHQSQGFERARG